MNVAIDINGITAVSGLANYLRLLIRSLAEADHENHYFLYLHSRNFPELPPGTIPRRPNFTVIKQRLPQQAELAAERLLGLKLIEPFLLKNGIDVFHGPSNVLPRLGRIKSVLTIHHYMGLADPLFWKGLGRMERLYFKATEYSLTEASRVIADSDHTRRDVISRFQLAPGGVTTVRPGPSEMPPAPAAERIREILAGFGLTGSYVLFVGPINERKNLPRLLEAFAAARASAPGLRLAVSGDGAPAYVAAMKEKASELGLGGAVVFTGRIGLEQVSALYAGALALCYPSLFEGFGYPPLEAMAAGCPVLASNAASIPEVVGDAGILFDPENTAEIAKAILRVTQDPGLRTGLAKAGKEQAAAFSWEKAARETLGIYRKVYNSKD